jgi:hypothetical protein
MKAVQANMDKLKDEVVAVQVSIESRIGASDRHGAALEAKVDKLVTATDRLAAMMEVIAT